MSANSFTTVFLAAPVIRQVARIEQPSIKQFTICALVLESKQFIMTIMPKPLWNVKRILRSLRSIIAQSKEIVRMCVQIGRDQVYCENRQCRNPIVLPHQSPLGIFQGFADQPTDEWPATFLCPSCGQVFVCSVDMIDNAIVAPVPDSLIPALLRVEYVCVQGNIGTRKVIYTTCSKDADPRNEMPRLLKSLPEIGASPNVEMDIFLYQL